MKKLVLPFIVILITTIKGFSQSPTPAVDSKEYEDIKQQGVLQRGLVLPNSQSFTPSLEDFKRLGITHQMRSNGGAPSTASSSGCSCYIPPDNTYTLAFGPNDDGSTSALTIPFNFCLYGINYTSLFINNNGNISFGTLYSTFSGGTFPSSNFIMIAPFWADVDTRGTGTVQYKITPTAMYINWVGVGYYNSRTDKVNTFQLIITNGGDPILPPGNNIAFCYGDMQWTTGFASSGVNGFGGSPATAGINKGDGINFIQLGRFDQPGFAYDGSAGANDGVDWLDNKSFYFNACSTTNIPPIASGISNCDTVKLCGAGDSLILKGSFFAPEIAQNTTISINLNGTPNTSIISNVSGNAAEAQVKIIASAANAGNNIITFTATDNGSPAGITVVNVNVFVALINPLIVTANATAETVCAGTSIILSGGGGPASYTWTGGVINDSAFIPVATTTYSVTGTMAGCSSTAVKTITVNPLPVSNAGNDLTVCSGIAGNIGTMNISGTSYSWHPGAGLSDSTISNPSYLIYNSSNYSIINNYTLTATNLLTGCQSSDNAVITVVNQSPPVLSITNPAPVCFPNAINLTLASITAGSTGGGTLSYWTDATANNPLLTPYTVTLSGTNYIKTTVAGGCTDIKPVIITIYPQPTAAFTTQNESSSLYCDGSIMANLTGGTGTIQDQWLNVAQTVLSTTNSVSGLCPGTYTINLTDANSCTNTYTENILAGPLPPTPPICMVTVDNTNTHNLVIWEKSNLNMTAIDSIEIYREVGTNSYARIGAVSSDSLSVFDDHGANPASTGYRYKLKSKNYHSAVSSLSDYHNTIYLTNTGANFSWTQYQVENNTTPVFSYHIYRDDNSTGNFIDIGNTTGNQFGYTDVSFASYPNSQYYVEAVMTAGSCSPTRSSFGASRSNVKHIGPNSVLELNTDAGFSIYPNPFSSQTTITFNEEQKNTSIKIMDVLGKQIKTIDFKGKTLILEKEEMKPGIYFLQISDEIKNAVNRKIVVQ